MTSVSAARTPNDTAPAAGPPVDPVPADELGLDAAQVAERRSRGQTNDVIHPTSRSAWTIVRANVFTRFNALLGALSVLVLVAGRPQDALFGAVVVFNSCLGMIAEFRAKRTLDTFQVIGAATARVLRDGRVHEVAVGDAVLDDVVEVRPGEQVIADGVVLSGFGVEADESLLTGEADPVAKRLGDELLSGSFVVAGTCRYRVIRVGVQGYANALAAEAREFRQPPSMLRSGVDTFLRWVGWALVPAAVVLGLTQRRARGTADAVHSSIAAVVAMVPEGLVLLVTIAFSLAVVRLGRRRVIVEQLPAVETLARVDIVCFDKTGTLTEGRDLRVIGVDQVDDTVAAGTVDIALGALAAADPSPNASLRGIAAYAPMPSGWVPATVVPFSSGRRWSGADFGAAGCWVLGAADTLLVSPDDPVRLQADVIAADGTRVVLLARVASIDPPHDQPLGVRPAALVRLADTIRSDAAETVRYFAEQGVALKVLSGDHPATAAAVARRVGIEPGGEPIDASRLAADPVELRRILAERSVLGRVSPQHKRLVVEALQAGGHSVAMVGDGVNDVPALKAADLAVAMGTGTGAARAVSDIVLVDDSFDAIPFVVREGRRVVGNIERVAKLFMAKSVYAFLLVVAVGIARLPFPFVPRHLTLVGTLTIGVPSAFLALGSAAPRSEPGFVRRVVRFAVPAGVVAAAATFAAYALALTDKDVNQMQARTTATMALLAVGLVLMTRAAGTVTSARLALAAAMAAAYVLVLAVPASREFFALSSPPAVVVLAAVGSASLALWGLRLVGIAGPAVLRRGSVSALEPTSSVRELVDRGEGAQVEFKSSLRWDMQEEKVNKALERVVVKTVAGFLNARGGTLLLGVSDVGGIVGLAPDYATLPRPGRDGFERHLMQLLTASLGTSARRFLAVDFADVGGQDVASVSVRPADAPVYLKDRAEPQLVVRTGNATTPLPVDEAVSYVGSRWPGRATGDLLEALFGRRS